MEDKQSLALDWWNNLPMFNMDKSCKRLLAARYFQTEQGFLTVEQITFIWKNELIQQREKLIAKYIGEFNKPKEYFKELEEINNKIDNLLI